MWESVAYVHDLTNKGPDVPVVRVRLLPVRGIIFADDKPAAETLCNARNIRAVH